MRKPSHALYAEADLDRKPLYDNVMIREMRKKEVMNSKSTRCLYEPGWSASGVNCLESKNHKSTVECCVILESLPISKFQNRNLHVACCVVLQPPVISELQIIDSMLNVLAVFRPFATLQYNTYCSFWDILYNTHPLFFIQKKGTKLAVWSVRSVRPKFTVLAAYS
jgi:hypothetical protein